MERPIFFSLLIIVSAYIPLFTLERVERRLFTPMAFTVCYALLGSMLLALTLIPVLATYLFRNAAEVVGKPGRHLAVRTRYERLSRCTRHLSSVACCRRRRGRCRRRVWYLRRFLGTEFLPQLDEGVLWIRANFPAGISLEKSAELASQIRALVKQSPEVKQVTSQTGRNDDGTDPYGPNRNEFFVALTPYDTWAAER